MTEKTPGHPQRSPGHRLLNEAGIIGALGLYGVVQERIMASAYGGEFFKATLFLVLINRLVAIMYTLGMIRCKGEEYGNKAPLWKYMAISFSSVAASSCQYEALKYVSFPVQMLGKSFKMIPVMLWGIAISRKRYGCREWSIALTITWGVAQFLLTGEISSSRAASDTSVYGLMLLMGFLGCDGFTSTFQEKLFKDHKTSTYNQMLYVNSCSAVLCFFSLQGTGNFDKALGFCSRHPEVLVHSASLSVAAVAAQFLIYTEVKEFGALSLAATMNLRQVLSILMSYLYFTHPISVLQFAALLLIFGALFYKTYRGFQKKREKEAKKAAAQNDELKGITTVGKLEELDIELADLQQDAVCEPFEEQTSEHAAFVEGCGACAPGDDRGAPRSPMPKGDTTKDCAKVVGEGECAAQHCQEKDSSPAASHHCRRTCSGNSPKAVSSGRPMTPPGELASLMPVSEPSDGR